MKKGYFYIIILVICCFLIGLGYGNEAKASIKDEVFTETVEKHEEEKQLLEVIESINIEINTKLPTLNKYINTLENGSIKYYKNNKEINKKDVIKNIGIYDIVITINDDKYNSKLIVNDTIKPNLKLKEVTIYEGQNYNINSFVKSCSDNSSNKCNITFKDNKMSKYTKVGSYEIIVVAKDNSNNSTEVKTKLNIIKKVTTSNTTRNNTKKTTNTKLNKSNVNASTLKYMEQAKKLISTNSVDASLILKYTNQYRKEKNAKALTLDNELCQAANIRALEMAYNDYFEHMRPNGDSYWTVLNDLKINRYSSGENIAYGYDDAKEVSEAWKASKGHYINMVNPNYNKIGIGEYTLNGVTYHVQIFAKR